MKKAPEKPSGPGELFLLSLKTASQISIGEGISTRDLFWSAVTEVPFRLKRDSSGMALEERRSWEKCWMAWDLISSSSSRRFPSTEILSIRFRILLDLAEKWKNFVFLSPSWSHLTLDFCFQWTDYALSQLWKVDLPEFKAWRSWSLGFESYANWASRTDFSASSMFLFNCPKTSKFHALRCLEGFKLLS